MDNNDKLFDDVLHVLGIKLSNYTLDVASYKFFCFIDMTSTYKVVPVVDDGWLPRNLYFESKQQFIDKLGSISRFTSMLWGGIIIENPFYGCKTQEEICILLDLIDV